MTSSWWQDYRAFGEIVRSPFHLDGSLLEQTGAAPTVRVEAGEIDEVPLTECVRADSPYTLHRDRSLTFTAPGVARYRCHPDGRMLVGAEAGADPADVVALLMATALPALIWLNDQSSLLLHAATVVLPGRSRAVAIAAPSGGGKSTILAQLVAYGGSVVSDDVIRVRVEDGRALACGLPSFISLRTGSSDRLGAVRTTQVVPPEQRLADAPLGAVVVLERAPSGSRSAWCALPAGASVGELLGHRHRRRVPALLHTERASLAGAAAVVRSVRMSRWLRPHDAPLLEPDEYAQLLELSR